MSVMFRIWRNWPMGLGGDDDFVFDSLVVLILQVNWFLCMLMVSVIVGFE